NGKPPYAGSGAGMNLYGVRITGTFSDVSNLLPGRSKRIVMLKRHIAAEACGTTLHQVLCFF
ncbi:MAG: hypothetical protein J6R85_03195, partial [Lentisphaeria bacterium]|nr:hypothetical protein [Lentisphaeria bacterium]